jgi:hypothetical protein
MTNPESPRDARSARVAKLQAEAAEYKMPECRRRRIYDEWAELVNDGCPVANWIIGERYRLPRDVMDSIIKEGTDQGWGTDQCPRPS